MNFAGLGKTIKLGVKSLWLHGLRSVLTTLGIVFGVCSVISMLAIGEGASREAQKAIARLGSSNLIIETVKPPEKQGDSGQTQGVMNYGLTYQDAELIRNTIPNIEVTVPIREIDQEVHFGSRPKVAIKIIGTVPWYMEISPLSMIAGRFLSSIDMTGQLSVCVLDESVASAVFAYEEPLGQDVQIYGNVYKVIGIATDSGPVESSSFLSSSANTSSGKGGATGNIYIPLTTAKNRFPEFSFSFSGGNRSGEKVELQKITVKVGSVDEILAVRDIIDSLLSSSREKQDYRIVVPLELLRQAAATRRIFSIVLGSIAAISLLVGGIGIMNIMLATVSERTREIGIRRALGARKTDIVVQFLSETLILTLAGGFIGIVLGSAIPLLVTYFADMPTVITGFSLILAFGISAGIGVGFGLYPAYRAANMDPIESLRHE